LTGIRGGQKTANFDQNDQKKSEKITKNDQKMMSKMSEKNVILNGKSEKMTKIDQKSSKNVTF